MSFLPLIVIMLLMYMFLIRPQQKRAKEQQALVRSLAPGDEVLLNSGIHGVVKEVEEENGVIWLEVAQDLELKVLRTAVDRKFQIDTDESSSEDSSPID
ncbi:MAG: preprotein translocase subunit YajC [Acidimicrobiales bacterium]|nr:preprotein translocase subunit YajC [Actinomycetota bacterium]HAQ04269.1 preprotein translocase subunit YajC [Acidimicrobiaceae bacterium]